MASDANTGSARIFGSFVCSACSLVRGAPKRKRRNGLTACRLRRVRSSGTGEPGTDGVADAIYSWTFFKPDVSGPWAGQKPAEYIPCAAESQRMGPAQTLLASDGGRTLPYFAARVHLDVDVCRREKIDSVANLFHAAVHRVGDPVQKVDNPLSHLR